MILRKRGIHIWKGGISNPIMSENLVMYEVQQEIIWIVAFK